MLQAEAAREKSKGTAAVQSPPKGGLLSILTSRLYSFFHYLQHEHNDMQAGSCLDYCCLY